jgi:hypothetical protein
LPKPLGGSTADPDEPAMQVAVLQQLVSASQSADLCVKIWPQQFNTGPVPLPVGFADLPDPTHAVIAHLGDLGSRVLPGSRCRVGQSGNTVVTTGARASAAILHGVVWKGATAEILVDILHGMDGHRVAYRLTPVAKGWRAELEE